MIKLISSYIKVLVVGLKKKKNEKKVFVVRDEALHFSLLGLLVSPTLRINNLGNPQVHSDFKMSV